jgi:hypothetical protein
VARATSAQQARRNREIVLDRARGFTWATVAERHGITTRRAQQVVRESRERSELEESADLEELVKEEIEALDQLIEDLADREARSENEAVKLGNTKLRLKGLERRVELRQALGILPDELRRIESVARADDLREALDQTYEQIHLAVPPEVFEPFRLAFRDVRNRRAAEASRRRGEKEVKYKRAQQQRHLEAELRNRQVMRQRQQEEEQKKAL